MASHCRTWNFHSCKVPCSCTNHRPLLCFCAVTGVSKFVMIAQSCNAAHFLVNVKIHQHRTGRKVRVETKTYLETLGHADQELSVDLPQHRSWRHSVFKMRSLRDVQKSRRLMGRATYWNAGTWTGWMDSDAETWQKPW